MGWWLVVSMLWGCGSSDAPPEPPPSEDLTIAAPPPSNPARTASKCDELRQLVVEKYGKEKWRDLGDRLIDLLDTPDIEALCESLKGQDADGIIAGVEKVEANAAAAPEEAAPEEAAPAQDADPE